jgi:glutamate carboxypeptidase
LNVTEQKIVSEIRKRLPYHLQLLKELVNTNSGSLNVAGVKQVGNRLATEYKRIGFITEWVNLPDSMKRAGHLVAYRTGNKGKKLFLAGHLDTVFEPDMEANPWRLVNDSTVTGQGVADMKGGDVIMLAACEALQSLGLINDAGIVAYYTGDEEKTGKPEWASRQDFIQRAKACDIALGFETAQGLGTVATGRRGSSHWHLTVEAKQGHSAGIFGSNAGYGAVFETARILNEFRQQLSGEKYLTFNAGLLAGGTELNYDSAALRASVSGKTNIIPPAARASGDLRFMTEAQKEDARQRMRKIVGNSLPGTKASISFTDGFPAMEPKPGNDKLVEALNRVSLDLGYGPVQAGDPGARGAGDISWVAQYVDCIDGLGSSGTGAHAPGETMNLNHFGKLVERAAILMYRLTR